ncbi:Alpha/Beta hydrolase protein [Alternaria rosae]|uniref:Alpha/Beta hydrolase protein n=1 Tax=Alternaria rosae TaxID=1187941 RepID=UPI001E8CABE6|nr:Alpha/Beta hydrolase protein [Alternaria rosae]KAH6868096.1 Alpha/Beta hydrolase protein [Alternaria rosae]
MLNVPSLYRKKPSQPPPPIPTTPTPNPNLGLNHKTHTLPSGTIAHIWTLTQFSVATIILQHGYAEYSHRYLTSHSSLITHLLAASYTVYALDLHGHGASTGTPRAVVHVGKAVADHLALRRYAVEQGNGRPVVLFGHSLGGLITAGSVTENDEHIAGVILTSPAFPGPFPYAARVAVGVAARAMPTISIPSRAVPISNLTRRKSEIEKYLADPLYSKKSICFLTAATAVDVADGVRAKMGEWTVPTLVVHGDEDAYCDWRGSEGFVDGIMSREKVFKVVEGGRHELLNDECGEEVLEKVMAWIRRLL